MKKLKWPSAGLYAPDKKGLSLLRVEQIRMVNRQMHERIHLQAHVPVMELAEHICREWRDSHPEREGKVSYASGSHTHQSVCADLSLGEGDHISTVFDSGCCDLVLESAAWEYTDTHAPGVWHKAIAWSFKNESLAVEDMSRDTYWADKVRIVPTIIIRVWFSKSRHCEMKGTGKFEEKQQLVCS